MKKDFPRRVILVFGIFLKYLIETIITMKGNIFMIENCNQLNIKKMSIELANDG